MVDYSNSGLQLAAISLSDFSGFANDPDFRFLTDNWFEIDNTSFKITAVNAADIQRTFSYQTKIILIVLTSVHVAVFIIFIVILDVYAVKRFLMKQTEMLNIFQTIPEALKVGKLRTIAQTIDEDPLNLTETVAGLDLSSFHTVGMNSFRYQYMIYCVSTIGLAVLYAFLNYNHIGDLEIAFDELYTTGRLVTSVSRATGQLNEILTNDTLKSHDALLKQLTTWADSATSQYDQLLYGPVTDKYHDVLFAARQSALSVANNESSEHTNLNYSAYSPGRLVDLSLWELQTLTKAAILDDQIKPNQLTVNMLTSILEPHLLETWRTLAEKVVLEIPERITEEKVLLSAETIVIIIGQFVIFVRMIQHLRLLDLCNIELVIRLPIAVRYLPEVMHFINSAAESTTGIRGADVLDIRKAITMRPKSKIELSNQKIYDKDAKRASSVDIVAANSEKDIDQKDQSNDMSDVQDIVNLSLLLSSQSSKVRNRAATKSAQRGSLHISMHLSSYSPTNIPILQVSESLSKTEEPVVVSAVSPGTFLNVVDSKSAGRIRSRSRGHSLIEGVRPSTLKLTLVLSLQESTVEADPISHDSPANLTTVEVDSEIPDIVIKITDDE